MPGNKKLKIILTVILFTLATLLFVYRNINSRNHSEEINYLKNTVTLPPTQDNSLAIIQEIDTDTKHIPSVETLIGKFAEWSKTSSNDIKISCKPDDTNQQTNVYKIYSHIIPNNNEAVLNRINRQSKDALLNNGWKMCGQMSELATTEGDIFGEIFKQAQKLVMIKKVYSKEKGYSISVIFE